MTEQESKDQKCDRRTFMTGGGWLTALLGAVGMAGLGSVAGLKPRVLPDPSAQFKIGPPQDFPVGTVKVFEEEKVTICRDSEGMYAISLVCTHLGCIVTYNDSEQRFDCPCHGSKFTMLGKVTKAPAPRSLDWFKISTLPSGQLMVDRSITIPLGTKVAV
ncbi:MAG: Rieske 2Fe-2S domain-containing protein [Verrucomicrobia bacterium]|jgi:cytochrome b6-f complex iron-sulfur subunit|nr:Rieske 2Fe-2S domain-containing protein [Verrucomicrobiota bacterium]MBT7065278.1 Rieske 2Fe-2S domain-containing protein [Verrucomicrobiota bacterium]MBT7700223.1 Rieske 2Fe-2S domain-containing protein [Verrucomicrobiota bacterium]